MKAAAVSQPRSPAAALDGTRPQLWGRFEEIHLIALTITILTAVVIHLACVEYGGSFRFWSLGAMQLLGFVHFGVGGYFMAKSPAMRGELSARGGALPTVGVLIALSVLFYDLRLAPVILVIGYCHFAENAVYQSYRLASSGHESRAASLPALFPALTLLAVARVVSELDAPLWYGAAVSAVVVLYFGLARWRLPSTDWAEGWRFINANPVLIVSFLAAAFLVQSWTAFYYFTIWHFVFWFVYLWRERPDQRGLLLRSHGVATAVYATLLGAIWSGAGEWMPALLVVAGAGAFNAQTFFHIASTLVFRRYPTTP